MPDTALTFLLADLGDRPVTGGTGRGRRGADPAADFTAALAGTGARLLPAVGRPEVCAAAFVVAGEAARVALRLAPARTALHRPGVRGSADDPGPALGAVRALLELAEEGQILMSAGAARLVSAALPAGASLVYRGPHRLDAHHPSRVYELRPPSDQGPHDDAGAANLGWAQRSAPEATVGRDDVLDSLLEAWREAGTGKSRAVIVSGEAGIGKTTVVAELALTVHAEGAQVLYGRWGEDRIADYQGIRGALGTYAVRCPVAVLQRDLAGHVEEVARLLPDVGARLGGARAPLATDAEAERLRLFEAVEVWLARIATRRPLLLVLDDLHWAERTSTALLGRLLGMTGVPLLVVAAARAGADDGAGALRRPEVLAELPAAEWVQLAGLSEDAVASLVAQRLGRAVHPHEVEGMRRLCQETAGNPLFVGELLHGLGDDPARAFGADRIALPEQLHDAVRWRLDRLPAELVEGLAVAAAVGDEFPVDVVADVLGRPLDQLAGDIERALAAGIVREAHAGGLVRLSFTHGVVRRALQDSLPAERLDELHADIGDALARRIDAGATVVEVAHHHLLSSRDPAGAVAWARRAAAEARQEAAFESAVDLLSRAVVIDDRHGDDPALACELRIELASCHDRAGQYTARDERYLDAAERADAVGDDGLFVRAALGYGGRLPSFPTPNRTARRLLTSALERLPETDSRTRTLALARLATLLHNDAPHAERRRVAAEAVAMARRLDNRVLLARALVHRGLALEGPDDVEDALRDGLEVMRIGRRTGDPEVELEGVRMRLQALFTVDAIPAAEELADQFTEMAQRNRHPEFLRLSAMWRTLWAGLDGRWAEVEDEAERLRATLRQAGHDQAEIIHFGQCLPGRWLCGELEAGRTIVDGLRARHPYLPINQVLAALLDAAAGRTDEVRGRVRSGEVPDLRDVEHGYMWMLTAATTAAAAATVGDAGWADRVAEVLRPYAGRHCVVGYTLYMGHTEHHLGALAAVAGRTDEALDRLRRGLEAHRRIDARPWEALSARWLGNVLARRHGPDDTAQASKLHDTADDTARVLGLHGLPARELPGFPEVSG